MKKTVLITGASSGIGKAAAKLFASNNWNVIATMRTPDAEKDLICLNDVLVTRLDVQERDSIHRAIEAYQCLDWGVSRSRPFLFTPARRREETP